jgi:hypothetical protein
MFQFPLLKSPLAEKRELLYIVRKLMIGRRAYTDSIYSGYREKKPRESLDHLNANIQTSHRALVVL